MLFRNIRVSLSNQQEGIFCSQLLCNLCFSMYIFYIRMRLILLVLLQEDYDHLNEALSGTDHSWTALTLKVIKRSALKDIYKYI